MRSLCFIGIESWQGREVPDSAGISHIHATKEVGMQGVPLCHTLRDDPFITLILLACFLLFVCVLKNNKKYVGQHLKNLFVQKRRASLFDDSTEAGNGFMTVLSFVTCVLAGICLYKYSITIQPFLSGHVPALLLVGIYIACACFYVLLKWGFYDFINWIFFDKEQRDSWNVIYFDWWGGVCFLLFPLLLLVVYLNLNFQISNYLMLLVLLLAELILFYKCIRNFFGQIYGFLHFILYFCALELVPLILFWKVIDYINNILILKI